MSHNLRKLLPFLLLGLTLVSSWFFFRWNMNQREKFLPIDDVSQPETKSVSSNLHSGLTQAEKYSVFMVLMQVTKLTSLLDTTAGSLTVFAPDNTAFGKLETETFKNLREPENRAKLTDLLTYHIVPGDYRAQDFTDGMQLKTIQGELLTLTQRDGSWWVNGTSRLQMPDDQIASNGVVHTLSTVVTANLHVR